MWEVVQIESWLGEAWKYDASESGRESEVRVRGLWPGGGYEGRPRLSPEDVWGGEEVGGRAEGVWGMRCPHLLRELRPSRAVLQGWGEGSCGGGRRGGGLLLLGGERTMGVGWGGRVLGCWVRTGLVGGGGAAERVWAGGLAVSFAGGSWLWGTWRGTSASPAGYGIQGGGPDRGQRWVARRRRRRRRSQITSRRWWKLGSRLGDGGRKGGEEGAED